MLLCWFTVTEFLLMCFPSCTLIKVLLSLASLVLPYIYYMLYKYIWFFLSYPKLSALIFISIKSSTSWTWTSVWKLSKMLLFIRELSIDVVASMPRVFCFFWDGYCFRWEFWVEAYFSFWSMFLGDFAVLLSDEEVTGLEVVKLLEAFDLEFGFVTLWAFYYFDDGFKKIEGSDDSWRGFNFILITLYVAY